MSSACAYSDFKNAIELLKNQRFVNKNLWNQSLSCINSNILLNKDETYYAFVSNKFHIINSIRSRARYKNYNQLIRCAKHIFGSSALYWKINCTCYGIITVSPYQYSNDTKRNDVFCCFSDLCQNHCRNAQVRKYYLP